MFDFRRSDAYILENTTTANSKIIKLFSLGCSKEEIETEINGDLLNVIIPIKYLYDEEFKIRIPLRIPESTKSADIKVENGVTEVTFNIKPDKNNIKINRL